jgi:hypothetical protein
MTGLICLTSLHSRRLIFAQYISFLFAEPQMASPQSSLSAAVYRQQYPKSPARDELTDDPVMMPVVAIRNRLPFVCFDIHRRAATSAYVQPPMKKTTVVAVDSALNAIRRSISRGSTARCLKHTCVPSSVF